MSFDHLWAAWRGEYVASVPGDDDLDQSAPACVFCRLLAAEAPDRESFIVRRGDRCFTILNLFPYCTGHLMVMPLRHVAELAELDPAEHAELWATVTDAVEVLRGVYSPDGFNVGANLGRVAGAGIPGHLHIHVLPRWGGDTNFMTSIGGARVHPEALDATWARVSSAWAAWAAGEAGR